MAVWGTFGGAGPHVAPWGAHGIPWGTLGNPGGGVICSAPMCRRPFFGQLGIWRPAMWPMGGIKWYTFASNSRASEFSLSVAICSQAYEALPSFSLLWPQTLLAPFL